LVLRESTNIFNPKKITILLNKNLDLETIYVLNSNLGKLIDKYMINCAYDNVSG